MTTLSTAVSGYTVYNLKGDDPFHVSHWLCNIAVRILYRAVVFFLTLIDVYMCLQYQSS